jgi:acyl-CoA reductase-like NAD-dependent aldehyde dehydrogenase
MSAPLIVHNPYSGQELIKVNFATPEQIHHAVARSREAFAKWRHSTSWERSQLLTQVCQELEQRRDEFAATIRDEAGKPILYANIEVDRAIGVLQWAAAETLRFSGELLRLDASSSGRPGFGIHQKFPRGVVLGITPFNFPLNLVLHKVAPAIAAGCSILIKPSPATPMTAVKLAALFEKHVPGLVQVVLADDAATANLTRAKEIATISFTGSARVGFEIRRQAPEKPTTLELGGNAWVIVMEDAPPETYAAVAKRIAGAAYGYAGQSCISVQNVAVAGSAWDKFKDHLSKATENTPFGDPADASVITGPLINSKAVTRIQGELAKSPAGTEQVRSTKKVGSGETATALVSPTLVLFNDKESMSTPLVQEEIFGPVMTARRFDDLDSIIARINSSRYGLQAGVYTQNLAAIERLYRDLEVGGLIVNDVPTTRYDHQPYGGVKESGQGREGVRSRSPWQPCSRFAIRSALADSSPIRGIIPSPGWIGTSPRSKSRAIPGSFPSRNRPPKE